MFIEKENVLSEEQLKEILKLANDFNFPWFYRPSTLNNFYYNSHALLDPNLGVTSQHLPFFEKIFYRICDLNNVSVNKILRMNVNMTFHYTSPHTNLHVDHDFPHYVMIFYLNEASGNTLIFEETYTKETGPEVDTFEYKKDKFDKIQNKHNLKHSVSSKVNKVLFFNGTNYHAHEFCKPDEKRLIFICTFQ